jgi:hypothetical protein
VLELAAQDSGELTGTGLHAIRGAGASQDNARGRAARVGQPRRTDSLTTLPRRNAMFAGRSANRRIR